MKRNICCCPECGGHITIWFDMNTEIQYNVKPNGTLSKVIVASDDTGEARFGIKCQSCSWLIHGDDDAIDEYETLVQLASEKAEGVQLVAKR
ncbi:TPA: hypothetical protein MO340_004285 [Salmonella enterica subsp. salamae serovar 35:g,m,s,t:-]|nr:hypothetical protein [Salmonella enterica subsp. salamae serovar 35:g,m,s,t:-]HCA3549755.1 hypothetical protein [Salmonella enterica subsp. salamae serovar 35:g,m,s,t:-]